MSEQISDYNEQFDEFLEKQGLNEDDLSYDEFKEQLDDFNLESDLARQNERAEQQKVVKRESDKAVLTKDIQTLEQRIAELKEELEKPRGEDFREDEAHRLDLKAEMMRLGPRLEELRLHLPFAGVSDDELVQMIEDRTIKSETLSNQARRAADPRFEGSPTLAAKLKREAEVASRATAEAEVVRQHRQLKQQALAATVQIAEKKAENDRRDANTLERIRIGRDPRARLEIQRKAADAAQAILDEQRRQALERIANAQPKLGELA